MFLLMDPVNEIVAANMKISRYDSGSGALTAKHFEEDVFSSILYQVLEAGQKMLYNE